MPKFVFYPPQTNHTREWAQAIAQDVPQMNVLAPDDESAARREMVDADAAFGTLPPDLLDSAPDLRWLQAPAIAPPAGYYSPELIAHPVQVTNFRGIFNDHISAHIMAFVLAFARGLPRYLQLQSRSEWAPEAEDVGVVH